MSVRPVRSARELRAFIALPYRLYARESLWAPPLRHDVRTLLSKRRNPFFDHGDAEYFLAEKDGTTVGRIAAITNRLHNETHNDRIGFFGFFECENDPASAKALLEAAVAWGRERGHNVLRGPASFSVNDECGLLVEGFNTPPTIMMPHNPPYYAELLERAGCRKVKDLWVYQGGDLNCKLPVPARLTRGTELMRRRLGVTLRSIDMQDFPGEVERIRQIFNAAWAENWGFVPMTDREIRHLATQFKPVVVPELVPLAEKNGRTIAFAIAIPDLNEVLRRNRSGRLFPGALKLLWAVRTRRLRRTRIVLLGVLPEYRGKGIDAMLYQWIWTQATQLGFYWGEAGWILEDNPAMNHALQKMGFSHYKTYRFYELPL